MTEDLLKVKTLLKTRGCSDRTVTNYISCINRFKNYFKEMDIQNFSEDDILNYINDNFVKLGFSAASINVNRAAIKYYYLVNFNKNFNSTLLPSCKVKSRFPILITKRQAIQIINNETSLKRKIWWCLGYGSGLRISEVANLKAKDILSKHHKIRVIGKGNKERFAPLPDITFKLLCIYYNRHKDEIKNSFLFPAKHNKNNATSPFNIKRYFDEVKKQNNLDKSITFHTLRHSFATEFIKSGGDVWELKSLLGHSSINSTMVYLHLAEDFSKVKSPLDGVKQ